MERLSGEHLRVAVVGLGKMGLLHASILNTLPAVEVFALCDKSALIRKFFEKVFDGLEIVADVEKLCSLDIDVVYVTTPIPAHFPVIKAIYSQEIACNVFVEKTLGATYGEARELCEVAETFGGVNMVGYMKRFGVTFRKAKDLLKQAALGKVNSFDGYAYSSDFVGVEQSSRMSRSRGGVLLDLGAHIVDLALFFFGDFEVDSVTLEPLEERGCDDFANFRVKKPGGLEGRFDISWRRKEYRLPEFGLQIRGSKGVMRVNDDKVELELDDGKSVWYRHDLHDNVGFLLGGPEYFREDEHFIESVLNDRKAEPSFHTASKVDHIIDQVKERAGQNA